MPQESESTERSRPSALLGGELQERLVQLIGPQFTEQFDRLARASDSADVEPDEVIDLEVSSEQAKEHLLPVIASERTTARLEYNLSRKGIWATNPERNTLEFRFATEDIVGSLTVDYTMGQLSVYDMELVAWIMGRWQHSSPTVNFYLRECAREFGFVWGGSRANLLTEALRRIDRTRFTGRVWEEKSKKFVTRHFGIFDDVQIVERRDQFNGPTLDPGGATVTVTVSTFMHEQLQSRQFVKLDWDVMRNRLQTSLGRRLYAFVESQKGWNDGTLYEITIDSKLAQTLGSHDSNPGRFRARLRRAGEEVTKACSRYRAIRVRTSAGVGRNYVLSVQREAAS